MKVSISVPVIPLLKPGHSFMSPNWNGSQTNSNIQAAHMYANFPRNWVESKWCLLSCMVLMVSFSTIRFQGARLWMQSSLEVPGEYFSITGHILLWVLHYLCCMVVCAAIWRDLWNTLQHDGSGKYWNSIPNLFVTSVCFEIWRNSSEESVGGSVNNKVTHCWYHQELVCWCHLSAPRDWEQGSSHGRKLQWRHGDFQRNKSFFMHHTFCHHCLLDICKFAMLMNLSQIIYWVACVKTGRPVW